jgi:hypothetical protein
MRLLLAALLLLPCAAPAKGPAKGEDSSGATPLRPEQIPEALKAWKAWALRGHEAALCPLVSGAGAEGDGDEGAPTLCLWPGKLELSLDARAGRFTLSARLYRTGFLPLPGDPAHWPQDVRVAGKPAPVLDHDGKPSLLLEAGDVAVSGAFAWRELPESLAVPPEIGLVALSLRGKAVPFPNREADGLLWLQREQEEAEGESRLDVKVWRRVTDGVPLQLLTRVRVEVSGKNREVLLGRAVPAGFLPLSLDTQLPARLEPDGRLRVQLRPGTYQIDVGSRSPGPVLALELPKDPLGPWAPEEIWAWQAVSDLRVVEVEGVPSVDAAQTTLPREWQGLPAYRVRPGEAMKLAERRRGDSDPAPDQLALQRTIWLDFHGGGATLLDQVTGKLTRSFRLEAASPLALGRVAIDGKDQLITQREGGGAGVEVRSGLLKLEAESRVEGSVAHLPASGWAHDLRSASAQVNVPPGWRLLHVSGVDDASPTWLQRWSLLDLFLVLVAALACGKLFGPRWGALAFAGLALSVPEGSPKWAFLFPLAAEALLRVVPVGLAKSALQFLRWAALAGLCVLLLPFAVHDVRGGMYPALSGGSDDDFHYFAAPQAVSMMMMAKPSQMAAAPPSDENEAFIGQGAGGGGGREEGVIGGSVDRRMAVPQGAKMKALSSFDNNAYQQKLDLTQVDPRAAVQSGPGLPRWTWQGVSLRWSGPVEQGGELHLWLLPPWANLVLAFVRVLLLALLLLRLLAPRDGGLGGLAALLHRARPAAAALLLLGALLPTAASAGDLPSSELIDELRQGLTAPPACHPDCAASPRLQVEVSGNTLRLRQELSAAASVGVPLPGGLSHWSPERVLLDGQPAKALRRQGDGNLWLQLSAGVHQVVLEGPLPPRDSVQIPLPLRPRRVEAKAEGWTVDGLHEDGTAEENLQLSRAQGGRKEKSEKLEPGQLPPFLEVERALLLGLSWEVETRVTRRSAEGTPLVIEVPLLPGESVTSPDVRAEKGRALVSFGPRTTQVAWRSTLDETKSLALTAPRETGWVEVWRLEAAPVWHVDASGLPPVHQEPRPQRVPVWRPWPGETLTLAVSRPAAVPGATLTLRHSLLGVTPGARSTEVKLDLELASSRGQPHPITLPAGASLQSVKLDNAALPLRQEGDKVVLALPPGQHQVSVEWREPRGIGIHYRTPQPDVGAPSVNADLQLNLGGRWVLFAGGPRLGPAVLFWSFLLVMVLAGLGLSRLGLAPLRAWQWVLLAVGLSQVDVVAAALVAGWLLALGLRRAHGAGLSPRRFDLLQVGLVLWTLVATAVLFTAIERGLLGQPEMQVAGWGSSASALRWFSDRAGSALPTGWVISLPIFVYRLAMLAWALWLASSLVRWLPWAWQGFSTGGVWKKRPPKVAAEKKPAPEAAPVVEAKPAQ